MSGEEDGKLEIMMSPFVGICSLRNEMEPLRAMIPPAVKLCDPVGEIKLFKMIPPFVSFNGA